MSQMLLINPRKRARKAATAKRRKAPSAKQRANWARFAAAARARSAGHRRAANPIKYAKRRRSAAKRRHNPVVTLRRRSARRRNPIRMGGGLFNFRSYLAPIKDAAVMGAGAVAVDMAFNYINPYLPASVQKVPGKVGVGDAVKLLITVALGKVLSGPTRGLSQKAAMGSLVVQARDITMTLLPPSVTGMAGLGFVNAGRVVPSINTRANANNRPMQVGAGGAVRSGSVNGLGMYTGGTPLLSGGVGMYAGGTPLLARANMSRAR